MANLNGGRGWLSDAAAASLHRMDAAYGRQLPITSAGRTNAEQWEAWRKYQNGGSLAAYPGTSIHESGNAVDFGSAAWSWLGSGKGLGWNGARANDFGFRRTVSSESWHYEYDASRDKYRGAGDTEKVRREQDFLNKFRGEKLSVDGVKGPATTEAYKRYQTFLRAYGYSGAIDGDWGTGTQNAHAKYYSEVTGEGAGNAAWPANKLYGAAWVKSIQEKLNRLGYGLAVDGQDGTSTQNAVKDFQTKHGISPVDGVAGPITNNKLDAVLAGNSSSPAPATGGIAVDGEWGAGTTRKLQQVLGVNADGELGPQTIKALQSRLGVEADGQIGPATTRALQAVVGAPVDGELGPQTVKALQNYLNAGGNFQAKAPQAPTPAPAEEKLAVDGNWGAATTRALQKKLGVKVDGELGAETYTALQKALGVPADGQIGPVTVRALQTFLGVSVDGALGPQTTKALQTFLNEGGDFKAVGVIEAPKPVEFPKPAAPTYPASVWWGHSSNSSPRDEDVQYFVIHHIAAAGTSNDGNVTRFMNPNDRQVSPNWYIGSAAGEVFEIVPPDNYRAWTSGSFDHKAVTVETRNTSGAPDWGISEESRISIAKLVAWASKRYGFPIDRTHVIGHRDVPGAATACPGPSMNVDHIIELAKAYAAAVETPTEPTPEVPVTPEVPTDDGYVTIRLTRGDAAELKKFLKALDNLLP